MSQQSKGRRRALPWTLGILIALAVLGGLFAATATPTYTVTADATHTASSGTSVRLVDYGLTAGQSNAIGKAKDYLSVSSFSRSGLIDQLEYEGFSTSDATYAVDSLNVDWNAQAVKKAKEYLSTSSFSHSGLVDQLEYEGFTPSQAEYGVDGAGL